MKKHADWIIGILLLGLALSGLVHDFVMAALVILWIGGLEAYRHREKIRRWLSD